MPDLVYFDRNLEQEKYEENHSNSRLDHFSDVAVFVGAKFPQLTNRAAYIKQHALVVVKEGNQEIDQVGEEYPVLNLLLFVLPEGREHGI